MDYEEITNYPQGQEHPGNKKVAHSPKYQKWRKSLMVLLIIMIPVLFALYYVFVFRRHGTEPSTGAVKNRGLNSKLPDPHFKKGLAEDKFTIYEAAKVDSQHMREAIKGDPYYKKTDSISQFQKSKGNAIESIFEKSALKYNQQEALINSLNAKDSADQNEKKLMDKLSQLRNAINRKAEAVPILPSSATPPYSPDIDKLDKMISKLGGNKEPDPEMAQLNGMLEKIMAIQHPESMQDNLQSISMKNRQKVFPVNAKSGEDIISLIGQDGLTSEGIVRRSASFDSARIEKEENGFFSFDGGGDSSAKNQNAIEASVYETKTIVSGSIVKLRLLNDVYINSTFIPKDLFIFGRAFLDKERLKITVGSIRYANNIFPVSLDIYDLDGMEGIYIPGSINRDVSKQSADQAFGSVGLTALDPSIGAQAASAGIQAAKTLLSRNVKLIQVSLKSGYRVLLKNNRD
jgi:conjugative transposon TraM protein